MSKTNKNGSQIKLSADHFQKHFDTLVPLILDKWDQLEEDTLAKTEGDLDAVIDYIKHQTDHKRAIVRRQLSKLYQFAREQEHTITDNVSNIPSAMSSLDVSTVQEQILPTVEKTLKLIEKRAESLLSRVETEMLPAVNGSVGDKVKETVKETVREKPGTSLLTAFGFGLFVGLIVGGFGRGRE